jgi:hypothetical protein
LEVLAQPRSGGNPPYIEESTLVPKSAPNERYAYDASGPNNKGLKPDISVRGPHGVIGNWMTRIERR